FGTSMPSRFKIGNRINNKNHTVVKTDKINSVGNKVSKVSMNCATSSSYSWVDSDPRRSSHVPACSYELRIVTMNSSRKLMPKKAIAAIYCTINDSSSTMLAPMNMNSLLFL